MEHCSRFVYLRNRKYLMKIFPCYLRYTITLMYGFRIYCIIMFTYSVSHTVKETPCRFAIRLVTLRKSYVMTCLNTDHSKQFHFTMIYRFISIACTNIAIHTYRLSLMIVTFDVRVDAVVTLRAKIPRAISILRTNDFETFSTVEFR